MSSETKVTVAAKIEAEKLRKVQGLSGCSLEAQAEYAEVSKAYRAVAMDIIDAYKAGNRDRMQHAEIVSANLARLLRTIITNG